MNGHTLPLLVVFTASLVAACRGDKEDTADNGAPTTFVGNLSFEEGFSEDPEHRDCLQHWTVSGSGQNDWADWCETCTWGFDLALTHDEASSIAWDADYCFAYDMTWQIAFDDTYWDDDYDYPGWGELWYRSDDYGYVYPLMMAVWYSPTDHPEKGGYFLAHYGDYFEAGPLDYPGRYDYYYTYYWTLAGIVN